MVTAPEDTPAHVPPGAILTVTEIVGPPAELLAASDALAVEVGARDGLLLRVRGTTADGIVVLNLWASAEARDAAVADERHRAARAASALPALEHGTRTLIVGDLRLDPLGGDASA